MVGYILPITQNPYQNDQYRMTKGKNSPHYVGKTYKVVFREIQDNEEEFYKKTPLPKKEQDGTKTKKRRQYGKDEGRRDYYYIEKKKKAELTGKGLRMNRKI